MENDYATTIEYVDWIMRRLNDRQYDFDLWDYWDIMDRMAQREYVWSVPHDENRAEDGLMLRREYIASGAIVPTGFEGSPCSVLEMLTALAMRMDDLTIGIDEPSKVGYWFHIFMLNLGLDKYTGMRYDQRKIDGVIDRFLYRKYDRNGVGGLFPLSPQKGDQRSVEVWYQMQSYVIALYESDRSNP